MKQKIEKGTRQKKWVKMSKKDKNTQLIQHHKHVSMTLKQSGPYHWLGRQNVSGFENKCWDWDCISGGWGGLSLVESAHVWFSCSPTYLCLALSVVWYPFQVNDKIMVSSRKISVEPQLIAAASVETLDHTETLRGEPRADGATSFTYVVHYLKSYGSYCHCVSNITSSIVSEQPV